MSDLISINRSRLISPLSLILMYTQIFLVTSNVGHIGARSFSREPLVMCQLRKGHNNIHNKTEMRKFTFNEKRPM